MDFPSCHKNRLETNSFLSDVPLSGCLRAFPHRANSLQVRIGEAIFVALKDDLIRVDPERHIWHGTRVLGSIISIIIGILQEFEYEASFAGV